MLQISQKPRVLWHERTELTEFPVRGVPVPRVYVGAAYKTYRISRNGYERHTYLTEVPGAGMNVLQNLHEFFVGNTRGNTSGMVLYVPY